MVGFKSQATLSYIPQATGQQERSVKTMIQTVSVYVESPLQGDRDDIADRLVHAINNSIESTEKRLHYLVHDWDAHYTLKSMTESIWGTLVGCNQDYRLSIPGHVVSRVEPTTRDSAHIRKILPNECESLTGKSPQ